MNAREQAVATVLASYQDALNQSSTEAVMKLYPSDGVFMPQHFPSSAGADEVRKEYDGVFAAITLSVKFEIADRLCPTGPLRVPIRRASPESMRPGECGPEVNQELFVFQKIDGAGKIARYCFSTNNPPRA